MDRICVKCGRVMEPIKNGFYFFFDQKVRTSDLWGCRNCRRFQIHGSPKVFVEAANLIHGEIITDPGNQNMLAVLEPNLILPDYFEKYMNQYYPHWTCWKEDSSE
jgi:hypothetical protein